MIATRLQSVLQNIINLLNSKENKLMNNKHIINLPRGDYTVELNNITITKYADGTSGDVSITFDLIDVPNELLHAEFNFEILEKVVE